MNVFLLGLSSQGSYPLYQIAGIPKVEKNPESRPRATLTIKVPLAQRVIGTSIPPFSTCCSQTQAEALPSREVEIVVENSLIIEERADIVTSQVVLELPHGIVAAGFCVGSRCQFSNVWHICILFTSSRSSGRGPNPELGPNPVQLAATKSVPTSPAASGSTVSACRP